MRLCSRDAAFTLVEVLVAVALLATVTAAVVLALGVIMQNSEELVIRELAEGLAQDLMDEILNCRYCEAGLSPYAPLGPSPAEKATGNRSLFDDIDDYAGLVDQPPHDKWGRLLGRESDSGERPPPAIASGLENFRREVKV
ncbi:type II secretion system protein, partial [Thermogutta sp.]